MKTTHTLTLLTSEIEGLSKIITKKQFDEYASNGMPADVHEDFLDSIDYCAPIFDDSTRLIVDGKEFPSFNEIEKIYLLGIKEYEKSHPSDLGDDKKNKSKVTYAIAGERLIKQSTYELTINEEFDITKLTVEIKRERLFEGGTCRELFSLSYKGTEFEFVHNHGGNLISEFLVTSDGQIHQFDFAD